MSPFLKNLSQGGGGCGGRWEQLRCFHEKAGEGTEHHIRAEKSWQSCGVCGTSDHSLGFTIFLLRGPSCSRECEQRVSCFLPHQLRIRAFLLRCTGYCCLYRWFYKRGIPCPTIALQRDVQDPLGKSLFRASCLCWVTGLMLNFVKVCSADL